MNRVGTPAEIWWEPYAEPKYDRTSFISDYIQRVDGNPIPVPAAAGYDGKSKATDLMVHFRHALHPKNPRWGWTPLATALRHVAGDNGVASYHASLLRNSAVPSGFVSPPPATQGAPQAPVSPDQLKELLERLERKLTGEGAGRIAGMTLPLLYSRVGFSPDEMAIPDLLAYYQSHICAALNVPMMLLGFGGGEATKTYSNYGECIEDFWRRTVIPMQDRHGSEIESQLFPLFDLDREEYRINWDRSKVAALQDDESQLYDRMQKASGGAFLTPNEVRKSLGKDDIEGGDELRSAAPVISDENGEAVNPFPPKAQKSFFMKVVDANGMSHGDDGKFDGGEGSKGDFWGDKSRDETTQKYFNGDYDVTVNNGVNQESKKLFGRELAPKEYGQLIGAPDGEKISVHRIASGIHIQAGDQGNFDLLIRKAGRRGGELIMQNGVFFKKNDAPKQLAPRMLAYQFKKCQELGVDKVTARAVGSAKDRQTGYSRWPQLGFNGEIKPSIRSKLPLKYRAAKDLNQLMQLDGGFDVWKKYGGETKVHFDLNPDSTSWKIFKAYLKEKGIETGE